MVLGMSFCNKYVFVWNCTEFLWMLTFRFLAGVSATFVSPQVWASIPLLIEKKQIVKAIGVATAGLSISQILGSPLGAYLATIHYTIPFYFIGILSALLVILIYVVLPEIQSVHIGGNKKRFYSVINNYLQIQRFHFLILHTLFFKPEILLHFHFLVYGFPFNLAYKFMK